MKNTSDKTWLAAPIGLAVITIACLIIFKPFSTVGQPADDTHDSELENNERYTSATNFICVSTEDWAYYDDASEDIQSLAPHQVITGKVVYDPTQEEIAYFVARSPDPANEEDTLLSVYKYNTSDYTFERIYRKSFANIVDDKAVSYSFFVIGYDAGKLGIYTLEFIDGEAALKRSSLNLNDPYAKGLEPYEIPDEALKDIRPENSCIPTY